MWTWGRERWLLEDKDDASSPALGSMSCLPLSLSRFLCCCLQCFSLAMHIFPFFNLLLLLLVCFLSPFSLSHSLSLSLFLAVLLCPRLAEGKLFGVSSAAHQFLLLTSKSCNTLSSSFGSRSARAAKTPTHTHTHKVFFCISTPSPTLSQCYSIGSHDVLPSVC